MAESEPDKQKALVSVQFETEVDLSTGRPERRMFVKMYFDARDTGLLADIGDRRWRTLCALATYMNEDGTCYPSQARIAKDLGTTRENVNRRVQELLAYRFQGRPILTVRKARLSTRNGGRWANNIYQILPVTGFRIFDDANVEKPQQQSTSAYVTESSHSPYVTDPSHRPVSGKPNTGSHHTNQSYGSNKTFNVNGVRNTQKVNTADREGRVQALVHEILDVCRDHASTGSYVQIARTYPEDLIFEALSLTKDARARGRIRKSPGAYFTNTVIRLAQARAAASERTSASTA